MAIQASHHPGPWFLVLAKSSDNTENMIRAGAKTCLSQHEQASGLRTPDREHIYLDSHRQHLYILATDLPEPLKALTSPRHA